MSARQSPAWHPWKSPKPGETKPPRPDYRNETERLCQTCHLVKPVTAFTPNRPTGGRREVRCKQCRNERNKGAQDRATERRREAESRRRNARGYNAARRRRYAAKKAAVGQPLPVVPNRWMTCIRAAMELDVSDSWVRKMVEKNKLTAVKAANYPVGGLVWRIDPASVAEMKKKRRGLT